MATRDDAAQSNRKNTKPSTKIAERTEAIEMDKFMEFLLVIILRFGTGQVFPIETQGLPHGAGLRPSPGPRCRAHVGEAGSRERPGRIPATRGPAPPAEPCPGYSPRSEAFPGARAGGRHATLSTSRNLREARRHGPQKSRKAKCSTANACARPRRPRERARWQGAVASPRKAARPRRPRATSRRFPGIAPERARLYPIPLA